MIYDINLIPKTRKKVSNEIVFTTTALGLCCTALIIYLGFYLPNQQKFSLTKQIREQEKELLSYTDTQENYITLQNQVDEFSQTDITLDTLKSNNLKMTKFINDIEDNIPEKMIIKTMKLVDELLTIEGSASSYQDMAQYIVKLRNMESVLNVTFTNAMKEDTNEESVGGKEQLHNFTIYINLNTTNVLSGLLAEQATVITTAGEEATQNETN